MRLKQLLACAATVVAAGTATAQENLARNGDFEQADAQDQLAGWSAPPKGAYVKEGGNKWIRFTDGGTVTQKITVKPDVKAFLISAKLKTSNLKLGENSWNDARVNCYYTAAGDDKKYYTSMPLLKQDSDWTVVEVVSVPPRDKNVDTLVVEPAMLCKGVFEVDDVKVVPLKTDQEMADIQKKTKTAKLLTTQNDVFLEGKFDKLDAKGLPTGWQITCPESVKVIDEGGGKVLQLSAADPKAGPMLTATIKPDPTWKKVKIKAKAAGSVKKGAETWSCCKIQTLFLDYADKKITEGWPGLASIVADADWKDYEVEIPAPGGDCYLKIEIGFFGGATGSYKVRDLSIEPSYK